MTSKIKGTTSKIFQNVAFILINALLYFYCTKQFGPFQIYSMTFFTIEQVKVLLGVAIVGALAIFYGPARGLISLLLGEFLVQSKLPPLPTWWFIGLFPLFLLPLFFQKVESSSLHYGKLALKASTIASIGVLVGVAGFFLLGLLGGISLAELLPQWGAFALSCVVSYIPMMTLLAVIFARIRQPREIYNSMLTHHPWDDRDHTISIRFGGLVVYLCTRCSGMVMGVIGILILSDLFPLAIAPELAVILCIILPAPGLFIWTGQKFGLWKDKTPSRILNGILLGVSIFMLTKTHPLVLEMTLILVIYFVIFYAIMFGGTYYQRKKMQREFEDSLRESPINEEEDSKEANETRPNQQ